MYKVALLLAEGFEEAEAITPADLLRRAGIDCVTVSVAEEKLVPSSRRICVLADTSWNEMDFDSCDGVVLPGGLGGTERLAADPRVEALLRRFGEAGKLTAAICAAPTVLARAGLDRLAPNLSDFEVRVLSEEEMIPAAGPNRHKFCLHDKRSCVRILFAVIFE